MRKRHCGLGASLCNVQEGPRTGAQSAETNSPQKSRNAPRCTQIAIRRPASHCQATAYAGPPPAVGPLESHTDSLLLLDLISLSSQPKHEPSFPFETNTNPRHDD
jgi:hypothetical protein